MHKVHPKIYRIKGINDWSTRGFYKKPAEYLEEDFKIREFLKKKIGKLGVEKIEIERFPGKLNIIIFTARPGLIIGRGGEEIEKLKKELETKVLRKTEVIKKENRKIKAKEKEKSSVSVSPGKKKTMADEVKLEIREVREYWSSASLVAQWVAQQLEKRMSYRRTIKQALSKIMANKEIKGARVEVSGRLDGSEMSRREWVAEGKLPRQSLRAEFDYAKDEAYCTYGVIGIKVWIYKGEKFD